MVVLRVNIKVVKSEKVGKNFEQINIHFKAINNYFRECSSGLNRQICVTNSQLILIQY